MATFASLLARQQELQILYHSHSEEVEAMQEAAWDKFGEKQDELLADSVSIFRFGRKYDWDVERTLEAIERTLDWRAANHVNSMTFDDLDVQYKEDPLFFFHEALRDTWGRPAAVLYLSKVY